MSCVCYNVQVRDNRMITIKSLMQVFQTMCFCPHGLKVNSILLSMKTECLRLVLLVLERVNNKCGILVNFNPCNIVIHLHTSIFMMYKFYLQV